MGGGHRGAGGQPLRGRGVHREADLPSRLPAQPADHAVHLHHFSPQRLPRRQSLHLHFEFMILISKTTGTLISKINLKIKSSRIL